MSTADMRPCSVEATANDAFSSLSSSQQTLVREQLDRILASPLFRNSRRFTHFLRYTVSSALEKSADHLKERTIGIEAFDRDPGYDTSVDPVVRVTAAAVRKRLKQYYEEFGHEHELRIEFARGSYVPEIKFSGGPAGGRNSASIPHAAQHSKSIKQRLLVACLTAPYVILICTALIMTPRQTALDQFLKPITSAKAPVLICIPGPSFEPPTPPQSGPGAPASASSSGQGTNPANPDRSSFSDSMVLASLANTLGRSGIGLRVRRTQDAEFDDLKDGPVILIGGFSNRWTMRLGNGLRFSLMRDGLQRYVADRQNPSFRDWAISLNAGEGSVDYAVISRVLDANTGRVLLAVAGIHHFGTESAAECFTDSRCFETAERMAPGDWQRANVQIVIRTTVIGNRPSRPQVLAATLW